MEKKRLTSDKRNIAARTKKRQPKHEKYSSDVKKEIKNDQVFFLTKSENFALP